MNLAKASTTEPHLQDILPDIDIAKNNEQVETTSKQGKSQESLSVDNFSVISAAHAGHLGLRPIIVFFLVLIYFELTEISF